MKKLTPILSLMVLWGALALHAANFNGPGVTFADVSAKRSGSPYPSTITVNGLAAGPISKVTVSLNNLTHPRPDDMEILLVSPSGDKLVLLADAGGASVGVTGITLTFDDTAASLVADAGPMLGGLFKPTCVDAQNNIETEFPGVTGPFNTAAPRGSATLTSVFGGAHDPNGVWRLYVVDDVSSPDAASFSGWTLGVTVTPTAIGTTTTLGAAPQSSLRGQKVTFTATVRKQTDQAAVTGGTVTFLEGATPLASNVAINASGQASFTTTSLSQGDHVITANYNAAGNFLSSTATSTHRVDNATVMMSNAFCNSGPITVAQTGSLVADVYPSRILMTNASSSLRKISVTVTNLSMERPDDLELLLVGPNGAKYVLLSDVGGTTTPVANTTLIFSDAAASRIPDAGPMTSGTFKPTSVNSTAVAFPAPAPAGPYLHPAPFGSATLSNAFSGSNPNGYWSLYVRDDVSSATSTVISGGWCLSLELTGLVATDPICARAPGASLKIRIADIAWDLKARAVTVQSLGASAQGATLSFNSTYIFYTPANDNNDSFTYTVSNGSDIAIGTITVTVGSSSASVVQTIAVSGGMATINFLGIPGLQYDVQRATNLLEPAIWKTLTTGSPLSPATDGTFSYTDPTALGSAAYYRSRQH